MRLATDKEIAPLVQKLHRGGRTYHERKHHKKKGDPAEVSRLLLRECFSGSQMPCNGLPTVAVPSGQGDNGKRGDFGGKLFKGINTLS